MKLLVCDVEGTIFKANFRFTESQYASSMWQPLARDLSVEKEESFSHGKWENSRKFPSEINSLIESFKELLLKQLQDKDINNIEINELKNTISEEIQKNESKSIFEIWFDNFISPMFDEEKGKNFYCSKVEESGDMLQKIIEDIKNNKYKYSSYMDWVDETVKIHQNAPKISKIASKGSKILTKGMFDKILNSAEYNDGVEDFFDGLDRNEYIPILISGGFQELVRRAQKDLKIRYGFGACEYSWKPVKKVIDGVETEIITEKSELDNYFIQPSDFENKFAYLNMFFSDFGLDPAKDWLFIGDGKNDVDIASKAPISFAINPHEDLAAVATYTVGSFIEIEETLEKIKKHEAPLYISKNNLFSNTQAVQTIEQMQLSDKKPSSANDVKISQNICKISLFDAKFKLFTGYGGEEYSNRAEKILYHICPDKEKYYKYLCELLNCSYNEIELNEKLDYKNDNTETRVLPSKEKTVIYISHPDEGTVLRLPLAGRKIITEICLTKNCSSRFSDLEVTVYCEGPSEYKDFIEAHRPDFLNDDIIKNRLNYCIDNKEIQARCCQLNKGPQDILKNTEVAAFDKPIILLNKSKWKDIEKFKTQIFGYSLVIEFDNSINDKNKTLNFGAFFNECKKDCNNLSPEDSESLEYLKQNFKSKNYNEIYGVVFGNLTDKINCLKNTCKKLKGKYFITEETLNKSKDVSKCVIDERNGEPVYKRELIKSGQEAFLLSLCTDIYSACKKEIEPKNHYKDFYDEIQKAITESGAKNKFLNQRDEEVENLYSSHFKNIDFKNTASFIENDASLSFDDLNHFTDFEKHIKDGLKIIESYRFFNEQNGHGQEQIPLTILQPLFNALETYMRAKLLKYFNGYDIPNPEEKLKDQTIGRLCYLFGDIVDAYNDTTHLNHKLSPSNPYFTKKDLWANYYDNYTDEFKKYDSLDKLLELCKSRGQKISHNNTYNDIEGINQIIIEIAAGFRCVDDISNLDISDKTTNYKECWKFWLDGIN